MKRLVKLIALFLMPLALCGADLAQAEIVVVVRPDTSISSLMTTDIRDIFLGNKKRLPNGDVAVPIDQAHSVRIHKSFVEGILGFQMGQLRSYWASQIFTGRGQPPRRVASDEEVKEVVNKVPGAIGYIHPKSVDDTVKVVYTLVN